MEWLEWYTSWGNDEVISMAIIMVTSCSSLQSGFTPLHLSSHYGFLNASKLLISKGASINTRNKVCLVLQLITTQYYNIVWQLVTTQYYIVLQLITTQYYNIVLQLITTQYYNIVLQLITTQYYNIVLQLITTQYYNIVLQLKGVQVGRTGCVPAYDIDGNSRNVSCSLPSLHRQGAPSGRGAI